MNERTALPLLPLWALSMLLFATGCGTFVKTVDLDALPPETLKDVESVEILNDAQLQGLQFTVLGFVEGTSCKNKLWDPPASRTVALDQARYFAWELGADALADVRFTKEGTSTHTNCWESIVCTAQAIRTEQERVSKGDQ